MTEKSDQYPDGVEPVEKANPETVELSDLVSMGQPVDLLKDDGTYKTSEEILRELQAALALEEAPVDTEPVEVADPLEGVQMELGLPELGPAQDIVQPDLPEELVGDLIQPIPHIYGPEDPGVRNTTNTRAARNNKSVIHLVPSTWNGANAFFKLRDFSTDGVDKAAEDIQECLVQGAFGTEDSPTVPNVMGFYAAGYDTNDKLYVAWVTPIRDEQKGLYDLSSSIGVLEVGLTAFNVSGEETYFYLVVPLINEASSVACCVPKYSRLKFTASPEGSLVTWDSLPWIGDRYSGLDSGAGTILLEVFYDKCGRGWTGIIEPHNTESILDTGYPASASASMIDIGTSGGTYVYTGGGPMLVGDLADDSVVSSVLGNDVHPCDADLPNLNNHILGGASISALVNVSDNLRIYTP
tara:strand:+ start:259 stop:1491 length:1233 start_codon:yes stop_codon:yes gene_type:complete